MSHTNGHVAFLWSIRDVISNYIDYCKTASFAFCLPSVFFLKIYIALFTAVGLFNFFSLLQPTESKLLCGRDRLALFSGSPLTF